MLRHSLTLPANTLLSCPLAPSPFLSTPPKTPYVTPLSATLTNSSASVASKRLTPKLTPLDATLTKNTGLPLPHKAVADFFSSHANRHSSLLPVELTPFLSCESTLLPKNTQGGGTLPSSSLPLSFFALPAVNCQLSAPFTSTLTTRLPRSGRGHLPTDHGTQVTEHVSLAAHHSPLPC